MTENEATFCGIPIPLTMEVLLDAMVFASWDTGVNEQERRMRQYRAFRARILRMDADKERCWRYLENTERSYKSIVGDLRQQLAEKDAENQRLREALEFYANEKHYDGYVDYDYQWTGEAKQYDAAIEGDRGEIARRALEGVK